MVVVCCAAPESQHIKTPHFQQEVDDPAVRNELIEASTALLLDLNQPANPNAALLPYVPALKAIPSGTAMPSTADDASQEQQLDYAIARVRGLVLDPSETAGMSTQSSGRSAVTSSDADAEHGESAAAASTSTAPAATTNTYLLPREQYNVFFGSSSALIDRSELEFATDAGGKHVELGRGVTGIVYRAVRGQVQRVAVKVLSARASLRQRQDFLHEMHTLQQCRDRHIVQFYGAVVPDEAPDDMRPDAAANDQFMLVMELMEGGTLYDALANDDSTKRTFGWWRRGKGIALDIARGLAYLHSRHITHMDVKSANVLLTRDKRPKIGDVGFAKAVRATAAGTSTQSALGTFAWSAPELLLGEQCSEAVDIFSFGVVLWEICTGQQPVRGAMTPPDPSSAPPEVLQLIQACRSANPSTRPSAKDVVAVLEQAIFEGIAAANLGRAQSVPLPKRVDSDLSGCDSQSDASGLLPPASPGPHSKLPPLFTEPPKQS